MAQLASSSLTLAMLDDRFPNMVNMAVKATQCREEYRRSIRRTSSAGDIPRTWQKGIVMDPSAWTGMMVPRQGSGSTRTSTSSNIAAEATKVEADSIAGEGEVENAAAKAADEKTFMSTITAGLPIYVSRGAFSGLLGTPIYPDSNHNTLVVQRTLGRGDDERVILDAQNTCEVSSDGVDAWKRQEHEDRQLSQELQAASYLSGSPTCSNSRLNGTLRHEHPAQTNSLPRSIGKESYFDRPPSAWSSQPTTPAPPLPAFYTVERRSSDLSPNGLPPNSTKSSLLYHSIAYPPGSSPSSFHDKSRKPLRPALRRPSSYDQPLPDRNSETTSQASLARSAPTRPSSPHKHSNQEDSDGQASSSTEANVGQGDLKHSEAVARSEPNLTSFKPKDTHDSMPRQTNARKVNAPSTIGPTAHKRSLSVEEKRKHGSMSAATTAGNGRKSSDGNLDVEPRVNFNDDPAPSSTRRGSGESCSEGQMKAFSAFMGQTRKPSGPHAAQTADAERGMRIFLEQCQRRKATNSSRHGSGGSNASDDDGGYSKSPSRKGSNGKDKAAGSTEASFPTSQSASNASSSMNHSGSGPTSPHSIPHTTTSLGRKRARSTCLDKTYTTTTQTYISNLSIFKPLAGESPNPELPVTVVAEHANYHHHHSRSGVSDHDDAGGVGDILDHAEDDSDDLEAQSRKYSGSIRSGRRQLFINHSIQVASDVANAGKVETVASTSMWRARRNKNDSLRNSTGASSRASKASRKRRSDLYATTTGGSPWLTAVRLPPRWLSLRNAMALTNVLIIIFAIIVIAVVSYVSGKDNARVALQVLGQVALKSVAISMGTALGRAEESNAVTESAVRIYNLQPDAQICAAQFWARSSSSTRWTGDQIYLVDRKGSFCGALVNTFTGFEHFTTPNTSNANAAQYTLRVANGTAPSPRYSYNLNSTAARACPDYTNSSCVSGLLNNVGSSVVDFYDGTQRPYFRQAQNTRDVGWTTVYNLGSGDGYGFTNVIPIHNRSTGPVSLSTLVGVSAVDIHLHSLSSYLRESLTALLRALDSNRPDVLNSDFEGMGSPNSMQFVIADMRTGNIVAATCPGLVPEPPPPFRGPEGASAPAQAPEPDTPPRQFSSIVNDPCLGNVPSMVGPLDALPTSVILSDDGVNILSSPLLVWSDSALVVAARYHPRPELQWVIVGRVPGQYFRLRLGQIYTLTVPLTAILVLVASALASFLVTRAIGLPLKRAAEKMMRIADLNFDEDGTITEDDDFVEEDSQDILPDPPDKRRWSIGSFRLGWNLSRRGSHDSEENTSSETVDGNGRFGRFARRSFFTPPRSRSTSRSVARRSQNGSSPEPFGSKRQQVPFVLKEIQLLNTAMDAMTSGLKSFSKYVPLDVVALLVKMKREAVLGVDEMSLSIFFSDIANFTTIAESMSPKTLVLLMSEYLSEMSSIILESQGIVDKFIGDAVMAFWNAPLYLEEHAIVACDAALKSQETLKRLREEWLEKGYPEIRARIGLNTGPALVGNLGSPTRLNYTCLGDTVNLASRLEGLNKRYNTSIIVSDAVRDQVHEYFVLRPLDYVAVKGKTVAKKCYELVDSLDACDPAVMRRMMLYEKAFDFYCQGEFEQAKVLFETYLVDEPWDVPAVMHLEECMRLEEEGVPFNWSPVVVLDEK